MGLWRELMFLREDELSDMGWGVLTWLKLGGYLLYIPAKIKMLGVKVWSGLGINWYILETDSR